MQVDDAPLADDKAIQRDGHGLKATVVAAIVLAVLSLMLFVPLVARPLDGDPALYAYIGDRLLKGDALYRDVWDVKPPGFPLLYSLSFALFGRHYWAPAALDLTLCWATAIGLFVLAGRFGGRAASWTSALFCLVAYWGVSASGMGLQAEGFAAPFLVWSFVCRTVPNAGRAFGFVSGALLCVAATVKTPLALFAVPWAMAGPAGAALVAPAFGAATIGALALVYLKSHSALSEAVYTLTDFAGRFVAQRSKPPFDPVAAVSTMAGGVWGVILANWAGVFAAVADKAQRPIAWAVATGLVLTAWQGAFWSYHWYVVNLFAAVGFGLLTERLAERTKKPVWAFGLVFVGATLILSPDRFLKPGEAPLAEPSLVGHWSRFLTLVRTKDFDAFASNFATVYGDPPVTERDLYSLAKDIAAKTTPEDTVWSVQMAPTVTFLAERREPVRFLYPDGIEVQAPRQGAWVKEFVDDVVRKRPAYILVARKWRMSFGQTIDVLVRIQKTPGLDRFFAENYELESSLNGAIEVYRLKPEANRP